MKSQMKPLKVGQQVVIRLDDLPAQNHVTFVEGLANSQNGEDCYLVSVAAMVVLPRHKIWDYQINASNCRGDNKK